MNMIKNSLIFIEQEIINKNILKRYLSPIENTIDLIFSQKFCDEIVKNSYKFKLKIFSRI